MTIKKRAEHRALAYNNSDVDKQDYYLGYCDGATEQRKIDADIICDLDISSHAGTSNIRFSSLVIPALYATESDCTATITFSDASNTTICTYTNDITVKSNRITNIHGRFFGNNNAMTVSLNTDWDTQKDVDL